DGLAFAHVEADAVDRLHHPLGRGKADIEPVDFEDLLPRIHVQRSWGSRASRNPSPMKLKQNNVTPRKIAGNSRLQDALSMTFAPSEMSTPQLVCGSCTPSPRKLMKLSVRITDGTVSVMEITTGTIGFGRIRRP